MEKTKYKIKCQACDKVIRYKRGEMPVSCECNTEFSLKPKTEYQLLTLQKKYLNNNKDKEVFGEMYPILYLYVKKLLLKKLKNKVIYDEDKVEDKIQHIITKLYKYYVEKNDFKIEGSFGGYINQMLLELYSEKQKNIDQTRSLNFNLNNNTTDDSEDELLNNLFKYSHSTFMTPDNDVESLVIDELNTLIHDLDDIINIGLNVLREQSYKLRDRLDFLFGVQLILDNTRVQKMREFKSSINPIINRLLEETKTKVYQYLVTPIEEQDDKF